MKKVLLVALLASGLMAVDSGFYVGADIGSTKVKVDTSMSYSTVSPRSNYSLTESMADTTTAGTLKLGYYLNKNYRAFIAVQRADFFDGVAGTTLSVGYDYLIGEAALKPFVGVIAGYGQVKPVGAASYDGNFFGGQVGVNYSVNDNISVEAAIRYMASNIKYSEAETIGTQTNINSGEIKSITNWFIGANYKF